MPTPSLPHATRCHALTPRPAPRAGVPTLALLVGLVVAAPRAAEATGIAGLRLLTVAKDAATLRVELTEADSVTVRWGEEPMAWTGAVEATAAADVHELRLAPLTPDRRYFYQLEIAGSAAGDIGTFVSGRSWVTRRATLLVTAAAPADTPEAAELADRLFARESDALVLLSGEGDESAFRTLYARAMGDRLVLTGPDSPAPETSIADVVVGWPGADLEAARATHGACWTVALDHDGGTAGADVVVRRAGQSSLASSGDRLVIGLHGNDSVALALVAGTLTATLTAADGERSQSLSRTCPVPGAKPRTADDTTTTDDGEIEESSMDLDHHDADCNTP